jgi:hypothetical protein
MCHIQVLSFFFHYIDLIQKCISITLCVMWEAKKGVSVSQPERTVFGLGCADTGQARWRNLHFGLAATPQDGGISLEWVNNTATLGTEGLYPSTVPSKCRFRFRLSSVMFSSL